MANGGIMKYSIYSTTEPVEYDAKLEDFFRVDEDESDEDEDEDYDDETSDSMSRQSRKAKKKSKKAQGGIKMTQPDLSHVEFRKRGKELIDFIADYVEAAREMPVNHKVSEGFLLNKMDAIPSRDPVKFDTVLAELKQFILPGMPHIHNPKNHGLMPIGASYASLLGSMMCDGLGCVSLCWDQCPAATELEMVVMNWLAKLMDIPPVFHFFGKGGTSSGGGIIQSSTTESLLTVTIAAKRLMLTRLLEPDSPEGTTVDRFVVYCSEHAHPSMERIAEIAGVKLKRLWANTSGVMRADIVTNAMEIDKAKGNIPFLVIGTLGTIANTAVDQIVKIGPACSVTNPKVWFHIEAGYAGCSFICREYQPFMYGIDYADSFSISAHKWMPINMDCACLWVKNILNLTFTFGCEDPDGPLTIPVRPKSKVADYRHWSLPMTRRFRALKLWTVFKLFGTKGLQAKIRDDVRRAREFQMLIALDPRLETLGMTMFGMVAFRVKRPNNNEINHQVLYELNKVSIITMTGVQVGSKFWLRFVVSGRQTYPEDVDSSFSVIMALINKVIDDYKNRVQNEGRYGNPNYKYVNEIGKNLRLDNDGIVEDASTFKTAFISSHADDDLSTTTL